MSRSHTRNPNIIIFKLKNDKYNKRQASKKARLDIIGNGSEYKKHYPSWDICDSRGVSQKHEIINREWMQALTKKERKKEIKKYQRK